MTRESTLQKGRLRPRHNPGYKYNFNQHLRRVGDFVETHPLSPKETHNIICAAHMWAWENRVRVTTNKYKQKSDGSSYIVRVTLVSNMRERDYR